MQLLSKIRGAFLVFCALTLVGLPTFAADAPVPKGKIVILVLDISGSIKPYFNTIREVLDKAIVKKRLNVGDYFELIPFGDDAKPMYSGQIFRIEDTDTIVNSLGAMKADNDYTDIGTSIKVTLDQLVQLKKQNFNLYEPLVLFLTDGDHQPKAGSPFAGKSIDDMFKDPFIGDKGMYNGWYIVGIGKNLKDLKRMAELSGREKYFITIEDLAKLESELDKWVSQIPPAKALETGEVLFSKLTLGGAELHKDGVSLVTVGANTLSATLASTYKQTPVTLELLSASGTFQSADKSVTIPVDVKVEAGAINLGPLAMRPTSAALAFATPPSGKGTLKIDIPAQVNHVDQSFHYEFETEFLTSGEIFVRTWLPPLIVVVVLIVLIIIFQVAKGFLPVPVTMEIVGKPNKFRAVKLGVGKKVEFGSKPGLAFKLEPASAFANVVGYLERTGKTSFKVVARETEGFAEAPGTVYTFNTPVKLVTREGNPLTIRFKSKAKSSAASGRKGR